MIAGPGTMGMARLEIGKLLLCILLLACGTVRYVIYGHEYTRYEDHR